MLPPPAAPPLASSIPAPVALHSVKLLALVLGVNVPIPTEPCTLMPLVLVITARPLKPLPIATVPLISMVFCGCVTPFMPTRYAPVPYAHVIAGVPAALSPLRK